MQIELVEYDSAWPELYEREGDLIRVALGDRVLVLEHVGSTSIPAIAAKPKIDVLLAVADSADEDAYVADLEAAGYALAIREPEWHEHRLFRRHHPVEVNLHVFSLGSTEIDRMVAFRDHLRRDAADRALYERTKRDLAQREWGVVQDYADAKTEVVEAILARAPAARPA